MMTPEEMKAALIKMNDAAWHRRDLDAAYEIYADEVVFQRVPFPPVVGKEANMQADAGTLAAFADIRSVVEGMIVEGDMAVIRWTWEGVHSGTSPSLGIPATGKYVRFAGCSVYHFRDGKIVEQWEYGDLLGLLLSGVSAMKLLALGGMEFVVLRILPDGLGLADIARFRVLLAPLTNVLSGMAAVPRPSSRQRLPPPCCAQRAARR
jgi:steroid delta-isomerase-like uncharacterized protein